MKKAVIILGHGSRQADADTTILRVAAQVRANGQFPIVLHAFLQHAEPDPDEAVEQCVKAGADRIVIVPFFLQPGAHVTKDVPAIAEKAGNRFPEVSISIADLVGSHTLMAKIVSELAARG